MCGVVWLCFGSAGVFFCVVIQLACLGSQCIAKRKMCCAYANPDYLGKMSRQARGWRSMYGVCEVQLRLQLCERR